MTTEPAPAAGRGSPRSASRIRGVAYGAAAALGGAVVLALLAGPLSLGAGLLVVAVVVGRVVALAIAAGAGSSLEARMRIGLAVALALVAIALGEGGTWLYARAEGGVLDVVDYLGQVHGPIVPGLTLLAAGTAWWSAR